MGCFELINAIKVRVFFKKHIKNKHLCCPDKNIITSSIQYGGIRTFLPPRIFLDLGVLGHFCPWDKFGLGCIRTF